MNRERILRILAVAVTISCAWSPVGEAAPPWAMLLTFNRVEADPQKAYRVGEENGPWMIMACSFSGEGAQKQAQDLAYELRKRYKLPAFTHGAEFKFGTTQARGIYGAPLKMQHRVDNLQEVAVLVGNYTGVDDPRAQKTLSKLKYSRPKCLEIDAAGQTNQSLAGWRMTQRKLHEFIGSQKKEKGPMGHAFITTNPVLPKEYFTAPGLDPLVVKMNRNVTHSLLDCPGKYTVQVATFKGNTFIKPKDIRDVENGKHVKSKLAEAADKAHRLTEALREEKGWEAYEFHDRYASIVTVGSFDSVGTPRADGKIEINPKIAIIMRTFGGLPTTGPVPAGSLPTSVKSLAGIPFDTQPIMVEVPKRSIGREMAARP